MSTFELAIDRVIKHEGGFVNNPNDPGGATKYGISLRWLKSIGELTYDLNHDGDIDINDIRKMNIEEAKTIYRKEWWDKYNYALIKDQLIATKIFDLSVNMGAKQAHKLVQRALWSINGYQTLLDDGVLGSVSLALINETIFSLLLPVIRSECAGFYRVLAESKKSFKEFLEGWLVRAYA